MKAIVIVIILIIAIGGALVYRNSTTCCASEAEKLIDNTVVIDVRTPEEYAASHVESAILFSLQDMQAGQMPQLDKETPVAVYCRSGNRSNQAAQLMKQAGFTNIRDIGAITNAPQFGLTLTTN